MTGLAILGLAFVAGLLAAGLPGGGLWVLGCGLVMAGVRSLPVSRRWRWLDPSLKPGFWVVVGLVGLVAAAYLQWRLPQPGPEDISRAVRAIEQTGPSASLATVRGQIDSDYQLTSSGKARFWLQATQLLQIPTAIGPGAATPPQNLVQSVTGRVYTTVPLLQATGLMPGQTVEVSGRLYLPQPPKNPGAFNFAWYLQREGSFAGLAGQTIQGIDRAAPPSAWLPGLDGLNPQVLRKRLVQGLVRSMGFPEGAFLGALVLGRQAVDLPADVQAQFVRAGLAHVLAASGFQIVTLLGTFLAIVRLRPLPWPLALTGAVVLLGYVWLAGASPSVVRAGLMGLAVIVGLMQQRSVNSLGGLLAVVVVMLLWHPLWIWDLGFQFSVLATLGLIVSAGPIAQRLTALPHVVAEPLAASLAATLWVMPVQLWAFQQVSPYGPIASALTSIPVAALTIAGAVGVLLLAIVPPLGAWLTGWLVYPVRALLAVGEWIATLPGSAIAVGAIAIGQLLILYLLMLLVWRWPWFHRANRWWLAAIAAVLIAIGPGWVARAGQLSATVLDAGNQSMLAVRDGGQLLLVGSGDLAVAQFTVLPFLRYQGLNRVTVAVDLGDRPEDRRVWLRVLEELPIANLYDRPLQVAASNVDRSIVSALRVRNGRYSTLTAGQVVRMGRVELRAIDPNLPALSLTLGSETWLLLGNCSADQQKLLAQTNSLQPVTGLWWPGQALSPDLLAKLQPQWAIASTRELPEAIVQLLQTQRVKPYQTGDDGAIDWTASQGLRANFDPTPTDQPL
jgi:competence protein ComEC